MSDYRYGEMRVEDNFEAVGPVFHVKSDEVVLDCDSAATADGSHWNGSLSFHVNEGGNLLTFKVKYSNGTVKSGTVALS